MSSVIISDTLNYRPDGTVSGITRVTRTTYTKPSGVEASEDVTSIVDLSAITAILDPAYAQHEQHNRDLEAQIVSEREAAATDKEAVRAQLQGQIDTLTQTIRAADAAWDEAVRGVIPA